MDASSVMVRSTFSSECLTKTVPMLMIGVHLVLQNAVALAEYSQRQQKQQSHLSRVNSFKSVIVDSDDSQDPPLDLITVERHHIFDAIERQKRFIKYVEDLKGKDEFQRARRRGDYHVQGA
jgi:hypothetical protein